MCHFDLTHTNLLSQCGKFIHSFISLTLTVLQYFVKYYRCQKVAYFDNIIKGLASSFHFFLILMSTTTIKKYRFQCREQLFIFFVFGRCSVNPILSYWGCLFFINIRIFHHLKLEIALAIPASNGEK